MKVAVLLNGEVLDSSRVWSGGPDAVFQVQVDVSVGDIVDFTCSRASNAAAWYHNTQVDASIESPVSAVPEVSAARLIYLKPPTPNPSVGTMKMSIVLPTGGNALLRLFDPSGRVVETAFSGYLTSGAHTFDWNAATRVDESLPSGVYYLRLDAQGEKDMQRIVILR